MAVITQQQLEDASRDALDLGLIVNGAADRSNPGHENGTVTTRLGLTVKTVARVIGEISASSDLARAWASQTTDTDVDAAYPGKRSAYINALRAETAKGGSETARDASQGYAAAAAASAATVGNLADLSPAFGEIIAQSAPPSLLLESIGISTAASYTTSGVRTWVLDDSVMLTTRKGYASYFYIRFNTALVGRTVEFYVLRPSSGLVIWRSGLMPCEASGINTVPVPIDDASVFLPGDIMGAVCSAVANADGPLYTARAGFHTLSAASSARLVVGNAYATGLGVQTTIQPVMGFATIPVGIVVGNKWLGAAFGVAGLGPDARVKGSQLPLYAGKKIATGDVTITQESGSRVFRVSKFDVTDDKGPLKPASSFAFANTTSFLFASYDGASPGFSRGGRLTEITIYAGAAVPAGTPTIQAGIFRPRTTPPAALSSAAITWDPVFNLGEWPLTVLAGTTTTEPIVIKDLDVVVQAGDFLFVRGPNGFGLPYGTNTGGTHEYDDVYFVSAELSDLTTAALDVPFSAGTGGAHFRFLHKVRIQEGPLNSAYDGPNARPRLDGSGNLPLSAARVPALPMKGTGGVILGSSISTPSGGGNGADTGHWPRALDFLQAIADNYAVGGSFACWKVASPSGAAVENKTCLATAAELTARFGAGFAQYSYQNLVLGKGYRWVVMPDWINDSNAPGNFSIGTYSTADPATLSPQTLYGAWQRAIAEIQADATIQRIYFQTPFHVWASYASPGTLPTEQANRRQARTAMIDLNDKMNCNGVIDYIAYAGVDAYKVKGGTGLYDTIHPYIDRKIQAAQAAIYPVINRG